MKYGQKLLDVLKKFEPSRVTKGKQEGSYEIDTDRFSVELFIDPIGMHSIELILKRPLDGKRGDRHLSYWLNNDGGANYHKIAPLIEDDIAAALDALRTDRILVGSRDGRLAMVLPEAKEFTLIYRSRFFGGTSSISYNSLEDIRDKGYFEEASD